MKVVQILSIILLSTLSLTSNAQEVIGRTKESAVNKTNNRVDAKIDRGLEKGLDSIEGIFKKKDKSSSEEVIDESSKEDSKEVGKTAESDVQRSSFDFSGMFRPAKWEPEYTFTMSSRYVINTTSKKGKVDEVHMEMYFSEGAMAMKMEPEKEGDEPVHMIFDYTNKSMITLTEDNGKKSGMAMAMSDEQIAAIEEEVDEHSEDMQIQKSGRTKVILGYSCDEYIFSDEDTEGSAWVTDKISYDREGFLGLMNMRDKRKSLGYENYPAGFLMQSESKDLTSGEISRIEVLEVLEKTNERMDLRAYEVMDPMQMMQQGR